MVRARTQCSRASSARAGSPAAIHCIAAPSQRLVRSSRGASTHPSPLASPCCGRALHVLGKALSDAEPPERRKTLGHRLVMATELVQDHHAAIVGPARRPGNDCQALSFTASSPRLASPAIQ